MNTIIVTQLILKGVPSELHNYEYFGLYRQVKAASSHWTSKEITIRLMGGANPAHWRKNNTFFLSMPRPYKNVWDDF